MSRQMNAQQCKKLPQSTRNEENSYTTYNGVEIHY